MMLLLILYIGAFLVIGSLLLLSRSSHDNNQKLSHEQILRALEDVTKDKHDGTCHGFTINWAVSVARGKEQEFYQQIGLLRTYKHDLTTTLQHIDQQPNLQQRTVNALKKIPELLWSITKAQSPGDYRTFYGMALDQPDINPILAKISPQGTKVESIYYKTHTFSSDHLTEYLNYLLQQQLNEHVAVLVSTSNHTMGIRRYGNLWHFLDINDLYQQSPDRLYSELTSAELSNALFIEGKLSPKSRRITLNTDFIGLSTITDRQLFKALDDRYPRFSLSAYIPMIKDYMLFAMAAFQGDMLTVRQCLNARLSIFQQPHSNESSPIRMAITHGRREVVREMLATIKYRVNYRFSDKSTLLHLACRFLQAGIIEDLLDVKGIEVDPQDREGVTPLMLASRSRDAAYEPKVFERLLHQGASLTTMDNQKKTAIEHAKEVGNTAVLGFFNQFKKNQSIRASVVYAPVSSPVM
jgi:hypothetical protein